MFDIRALCLCISIIYPLFCSENRNEYIEIMITSSSEEKLQYSNEKKVKLCWDNDWYVLSALCLSGAAGTFGAIAVTPCMVFKNYPDAALYTGITGASVAAIWTVPQICYWCYNGCKYLKQRITNKEKRELI
jgi:hypothetical protein